MKHRELSCLNTPLWPQKGALTSRYMVLCNSQLFTVPFANKLVMKWGLSNYSTPESYLYGSRCWIHVFRVFGSRVFVDSIRINGLLVSCSLLKVLYLVLCASSWPPPSFLIIFQFGKENSPYLESSCCTCLIHCMSPFCFSSSLTANLSDHTGNGALGISGIKLAVSPEHLPLELLSIQRRYSVCSYPYGFSWSCFVYFMCLFWPCPWPQRQREGILLPANPAPAHIRGRSNRTSWLHNISFLT